MIYEVKVVAEPSNPNKPQNKYQKAFYSGVFFEKNDENLAVTEVKKSIATWAKQKLQKNNEGLVINVSVSLRKLPDDFILSSNDVYKS